VDDPQWLQRYLESNSALYPMFYNVVVYSPEGVILADYPPTPGYLGRNLGNLEYIQKTRATAKPYISQPLVSPISKQPLIIMTAPVLDAEGKLVAILGGSQYFLEQNIFATLAGTKIGNTGYFALITQDRVVVAAPDRKRIMQTIPAGINVGLEAALKGSTYSGETLNSRGIPLLASYRTLNSTGWVLLAALPIEEAYLPIRRLRDEALGVALVLAVLLPSVVWLVMRYLTQPIIALRDRIRAMVAAPEVDMLVDESASDEIGEVAQAFNDLTEARNRAQRALRQQEAVLQGFFDSSNVLMSIIEVAEDDVIYVLPNRGIAQFYGLSAEQMTGKRASELAIPPDTIRAWTEQIRRCLDTRQRVESEFGFAYGGQAYCQYVYFSPLTPGANGRPRVGLVATDITERKLARQRLERVSKLYAALSETSQAIVRERDRDRLMQRICDIAVEHGEFRLAWIGMINTETAAVQPVARAGKEAALPYVDALRISLDPRAPEGNVPTAIALRRGTEYVCNDFATDPAMLPNRERAKRHGLGCGAAFPLREAGKVIAALVVYAEEVDVFHDDILKLLREMADDISFAFDNFIQEALRRQAEAQLRHLFAASPAAIILQYPVTDRSGRRLRAVNISPVIEHITGYTPAECLAGDPCQWWYQHVHPDDVAGAMARQELLWQQGKLMDEYRLQHRDGSYRLIQDNAIAFHDAGGKITEVIRLWFDITEFRKAEAALHQSEEQFRDLVDTTRDVIYAVTPAGVIVSLNPAFETITGWSRQEWIGKHYTALMHPDDRNFAAKMLQGILRGAMLVPFRLRIRTRTGGYAVLEIQASIRQREGQTSIVLGIGRDLTERLNLEAQLRQSQKMEAIGQLAGGIAHDFNNILTAIAGNNRLARSDLAAKHPAQESLEEIDKATQRAIDLVRQILTFGRQQEQRRKPVQMKGVVEEALKLMRATLPATIEIHTDFSTATPTVLADPTEIHQVVMNIVSNAADAMREREGTLQVRLAPIDVDPELARTLPQLAPGRYAHLSIADTGVGMEAAALERIFEPFFTTKALGQGTGLGLSVVHGIMQNHDGAVLAESEPGRGATFHLYFPAIDKPVAEETRPAPLAFRGNGELVLFVDDEAPLVFLATRTLERMGYRVAAYTHPEEALIAFSREPNRFDAVITDISMPKMTGPELATRLLQIRPDIPIIITSGYIRAEDTEAARRIGVQEIVFKPNTINEFAEILRGALERAPEPS
jgi:PAS domain S-box-containing protein